MTGRSNRVKVNNVTSEPTPVSTGVGEGSVLGPFIFLIQIIEVSEVMEMIKEEVKEDDPILYEMTELATVQFADDCTNVIETSIQLLSQAARRS